MGLVVSITILKTHFTRDVTAREVTSHDVTGDDVTSNDVTGDVPCTRYRGFQESRMNRRPFHLLLGI